MKKMKNGSINRMLVASLGVASFSALAQTPPGAIPLGPLMAYPEVQASIKRDSNIANASEANKRADTVSGIKASVRFDLKQASNTFDFGYSGNFLSYTTSASDNARNHEYFANGNLLFDARNNLRVRLQYQDASEARGSTPLPGVQPATPNEAHRTSVSGLYTYGAEDAQGRLELQAGSIMKEYTNNRATTAALDQDNIELGGTFLWRVMPKTYATFTARQTDNDYSLSTSTLDSKDRFYLVGARWEATALTSGRFSVGQQTRKFATPTIAGVNRNFSGTSWEGGINWKPLSYSSVDFTTKRAASDSSGLGNFTLNQNNQAVWTHAWTSSISSFLTAGQATDKFSRGAVTGGTNDRSDTTNTLGLRVSYAIQRWLKAGAEFTDVKRNSNDNTVNYKRNTLMFTLAATL